MKSILLLSALVLGTASAANASTHGDSMYRDLVRPHGHSRSGAVYNASVNACYTRAHQSRTAVHDSPAFKSCMLGKGYRFEYTKVVHDRAPAPSYAEAPANDDTAGMAAEEQRFDDEARQGESQRQQDQQTQDMINTQNEVNEQNATAAQEAAEVQAAASAAAQMTVGNQ
jgi:hypothetical protein